MKRKQQDNRNTLQRVGAFLMAGVMSATMMLSASAASVTFGDSVINPDALGSIEVHKYSYTEAAKPAAEGGIAWTEDTYLSTGKTNTQAETALAPYALEGVEYKVKKVGDIKTYSQDTAQGGNADQVIYGLPTEVETILGIQSGSSAVTSISNTRYYSSDTIQQAMRDKLTANSRDTKDKLEAYINTANNGAITITTDTTGKAQTAKNLPVGLYMVVETKVPETVTETVAPFFVSIPMTDSMEHDNSGKVTNGTNWFYDVKVYPKNETGEPSLIKQVSDVDHGLSFGAATNGFEDVATVSEGDKLTYRLVSDLPRISTTASYLDLWQYVDTMPKGVQFSKADSDIKILIYRSMEDALNDYRAATATQAAQCGGVITDTAHKALATWNYTNGSADNFFNVAYANANGVETITVSLTAKGLKEVNEPVSVTDQHGKYSECVMVVYYNATVKTTADMILGDKGNTNEVKLNWKRTSEPTHHLNQLKDECNIYAAGIDLTKTFSKNDGKFTDVEFTMENVSNVTGKYFVVARKDSDGVYYVTGTTTTESEATHFVPKADDGKLLIYGLEEDTYEMTEVKTSTGYTLLRDKITIDFDTTYDAGQPQTYHQESLYTEGDSRKTVKTSTYQVGTLTFTTKVDGKSVDMTANGTGANASAHALVPMKVLNTKSPDLPKTGGAGTLVTSVAGLTVMAGLIIAARKGKSSKAK